MNRLKTLLLDYWELLLFWAVGIIVVLFLFLYRLSTLVPGLSRPEVLTRVSSLNLRALSNNPLNLQYRLLVYGLNKSGHYGPFLLRSVSVVFAIATIWLFYYIVSNWHDKRVAVIGTFLFATSAWYLHYARLAIPDITLTLLLASLAYGHWIRHTKKSALAGILGVVLVAGLVYIPGLIWIVVLGGIWQSKQIGAHLKESKLSVPLIFIIGIVLLMPLAYAIGRQPDLIRPWLGIPNQFPKLIDLFRHILNVPVQLFLKGPANPVIWLGRLPLLDILAITASVLGAYTYYQKRSLDRSKIIVATLFFATVLIGLHGGVTMIILAPFIYLLVTAGIGYLLNQWLKVFPRNPLARTIGVSLIVLVVLLAAVYNLRHYFIAWPQASATKAAFSQKY